MAISPENGKDVGLAWKICGFEIKIVIFYIPQTWFCHKASHILGVFFHTLKHTCTTHTNTNTYMHKETCTHTSTKKHTHIHTHTHINAPQNTHTLKYTCTINSLSLTFWHQTIRRFESCAFRLTQSVICMQRHLWER